jgi:hypothetical protein
VTALGSLPFVVPTATPLLVDYSPDSVTASEGVVTNISLSGIPNLSLNSTGPLKTLSSELGLNVSLPSVTWGIDLGSNLGDLNLPVNAGVPYFYASIGTGFSASFGGASVSSEGQSLAFAFDPADPSVAVRIGSFAVGGSLKGEIPFTPWAQPTAAKQPIFGNLYGEANDIQPDPEIPITLSGAIAINLDAKNTGHPLGISGNTFSELLDGKESFGQLAKNAINDLAIGVNGNVSLGYDLAGFSFTLPLADATVMYSPGLFAIHADNPDLFAGTPLESSKGFLGVIAAGVKPPEFSVDGSISWGSSGSPKWHVTATADNVPVAGGFAVGQAQITLANTGITADAQVSTLLNLGTIDLNGSINFDGTFILTATANANLGSFAGATFDFSFSNESGAVELGAELTASASVRAKVAGLTVASASVSVDAALSFSVGSDGVDVSGSGEATGSVYVAGIGGSLSLGVSFDNSGFSVSLPSPLPTLSVSW